MFLLPAREPPLLGGLPDTRQSRPDFLDTPVRLLQDDFVGDTFKADNLDALTGDRELLCESLMSVERKMALRLGSVFDDRIRADRT